MKVFILNHVHWFSGYDLRIKLEAESGSLPNNVSCVFSALCLLHKSIEYVWNKKKNLKVEVLISGD